MKVGTYKRNEPKQLRLLPLTSCRKQMNMLNLEGQPVLVKEKCSPANVDELHDKLTKDDGILLYNYYSKRPITIL
jgi:hypothetical protein